MAVIYLNRRKKLTEEQKQHTGIMDTAVVTRRFR